jgi:transcriptional regulator with XRE-family HTH domain
VAIASAGPAHSGRGAAADNPLRRIRDHGKRLLWQNGAIRIIYDTFSGRLLCSATTFYRRRAMTDRLNPDALKLYRRQRGWSQEQLASESRISKTQISRWERGNQVAGSRQSSRDRLCRALGVKWEQLTRPLKDDDSWKLLNRVPLKGQIDGAARTVLTLVQRRFGLTDEAIMNLAPLAVLILAEQSLRARQTALDESGGAERGSVAGVFPAAIPARGIPRRLLRLDRRGNKISERTQLVRDLLGLLRQSALALCQFPAG